jgi:hypothetical protein
MIEFNGRAYAKNSREFTETLFRPVNGRTANGFYRKLAQGYQIFTPQKELIAFVKAPIRGENAFAVSAGMHNGRAFYMFGLSDAAEKFLGLDGIKYSAQLEACEQLFADCD